MIQTSREIAALAGEPRATIRVRNLQTNIKIGRDAWGRAEKVQPVLISASVSLRQSFETASEQDTVNASTIHYGTLSKAILEAAGYFNATTRLTTSRQFLDYLMGHLTSYTFDGKENANPTSVNDWTPVLDTSMIRSLELKITLPKASLLGTGVSLVGSCWYSDWKIQNGDPDNYSMELTLQGLRIPTLIGVNPNERLAKQIVVADIKIDQWTTEKDTYPELEEVVVKVSTFALSSNFKANDIIRQSRSPPFKPSRHLLTTLVGVWFSTSLSQNGGKLSVTTRLEMPALISPVNLTIHASTFA
jgi:dihydroneopterin aldolase